MFGCANHTKRPHQFFTYRLPSCSEIGDRCATEFGSKRIAEQIDRSRVLILHRQREVVHRVHVTDRGVDRSDVL